MNQNIIIVAGGTGNLGGRIVKALLNKGAEVRVLVRPSSDQKKIRFLGELGGERRGGGYV